MAKRTSRGLGSSKIDPQKKRDIQSKGGQVSSMQQDMSALGQKGGQAAQRSGHAHKLTNAERSRGGQKSSVSFTNISRDELAEGDSMRSDSRQL